MGSKDEQPQQGGHTQFVSSIHQESKKESSPKKEPTLEDQDKHTAKKGSRTHPGVRGVDLEHKQKPNFGGDSVSGCPSVKMIKSNKVTNCGVVARKELACSTIADK